MPALVPPEPDLSDEAVLLRPWRTADVPALTAACQDPEIPRWTVVPSPYSERDAAQFVAAGPGALAAGRALDLAIVAAGGGDLLGAVGLTEFAWEQRRAEIGYWVAREARGRGVAARAVRLLSDWALRELGIERVELMANPANAGSQRVAERAGFTREGLLRSYRYRHGVREDLVVFSRLDVDR